MIIGLRLDTLTLSFFISVDGVVKTAWSLKLMEILFAVIAVLIAIAVSFVIGMLLWKKYSGKYLPVEPTACSM